MRLGTPISVAARFEWVREIWNYRELFNFFVWRDIKVRYKQTILGALGDYPAVFTMIVFTIFSGSSPKCPAKGYTILVFSYSALVPGPIFHPPSGIRQQSGREFRPSHEGVFPSVCDPGFGALSGIIDFFIASVILFGIMIFYDIPIGFNLVLWPVLVIPMLLLALGLGMIFSSLNVKFRTSKRHSFPIQIWLFITPIIYPISLLPENTAFSRR
jgi:lipopolysaccharide transport system permease protein